MTEKGKEIKQEVIEGFEKIKPQTLMAFANNGKVELIIREGEAAPNPEIPHSIQLTGTLDGVAEFAEKRSFDEKRAHLIVNSRDGTIKLVVDEQFEKSGAHVIGGLIVDAKLREFGINEEKFYSLDSLAKMARMNRLYLKGHDNTAILNSIEKFEAERTISMKNHDDRRGNVDVALRATCKQTVEQIFILDIPIFEGGAKHEIPVEVLVDVSDRGVRVWLESVALEEILQEEKKKLMDETIKRVLSVKPGIVVIRK